jgi:uncharacterized protein YjeT (DUF2065 family)
MLRYFLTALALMLVLEGLFPFAAPALWREMFQRLTRLADGQVRFIGLTSIVVGLVLFILFY